jgi:hypothetical protein
MALANWIDSGETHAVGLLQWLTHPVRLAREASRHMNRVDTMVYQAVGLTAVLALYSEDLMFAGVRMYNDGNAIVGSAMPWMALDL